MHPPYYLILYYVPSYHCISLYNPMPCHTVPWRETDCSAYVPRYRSYYRPWLRESPDPFPAGISHFRPDTSDTVPDSLYPDDKMLRNNRFFHGFPYPSSPSQRTMPVPVSPKYMGSHLPSVGLTVLLSLTSAVCLHSYLFHPVNSPMLYSLSLYYFIPRCASYFTE